MFLFCELRFLSVVGFVSDEHHVHYGQHFACYGDDCFLWSMLSFYSFVEFSHARVVLSGGLGALAEDPSCSFGSFPGDVSRPSVVLMARATQFKLQPFVPRKCVWHAGATRGI